MSDIKTDLTSYPSQLDMATTVDDGVDEIVAMLFNGPNSAIVAIENELGVGLKGTAASLAARLAVNIANDGGIIRGNDFPVSPPLIPHFFYHNGTQLFYMYDVATASYVAISTTSVLADYVRKDIADTITAQHTFNPDVAGVPFVLGANAQGQKVVGLDADTVDGKNPGSASGLATLNASSQVVERLSYEASASGVATLNASSKVVQDPANATTTPTASKIPIADGSGKLASGWGGNASTVATLDSNTRLVQVANTLWDGSAGRSASATAGANTIPVSNGSNVIATGFLGSGSASAVTALFGDNSWKTISNCSVFTASGTFTAPIDTTYTIIAVGGGGGGGGGAGAGASSSFAASGGGGGGCGQMTISAVSMSANTSYTVTIGDGGAPGNGGAGDGSNGNNGADGSNGTDTSVSGVGVVAVGGAKGLGGGYGTSTPGGVGGRQGQTAISTGSGYNGGGSGNAATDYTMVGGNGGSAGSSSSSAGGGGNGSCGFAGSGGSGGAGGLGSGSNGSDASNYGAGGGGGGGGTGGIGYYGGNGGYGSDGLVIILW